MTIKQINKIRDFGVFQKFDWNIATPTFKTFNVLYGWNYSGKTTISRILRSYETKNKHADYQSSTFEIEHTDGRKYADSSLTSSFTIRVFNSDFINENFKWTENKDEIEPILMLGQQNIQTQQELESERKNLDTKEKEIQRLTDNKIGEEGKIQNGLTSMARDIKTTLSIPNYNKTNFEPRVTEVAKGVVQKTLTADNLRILINTYKSTDKKELINPINATIANIKEIKESADKLLKITIKSKVIERLKSAPLLNEWVKKGRELHFDKTNCEFCGGVLPTDLLENLSNHFSKDYDILMADLSNEISQSDSKVISVRFPEAAIFYTEFQTELLDLKSKFEGECQSFNTIITSLKKLLEAKKFKPFDEIFSPAFLDNSESIKDILKCINALITKHNLKTADFQRVKTEALEKILYSYALKFSIDTKYNESKKIITDSENKLLILNKEIQTIKTRILQFEKQLSETVKGAEKINEYLFQYFGKKDIQIAVSSNKRFQLQRKGILAKNLSEGEKTAIAFAYFITRLEDKNTDLLKTIVYIDDPISSLDSNHLFNTYSFIKDKFYYFDDTATTNKHKCRALQFFISTHNFEFFNLMKEWLKKIKDNDKAFYLIERITNNTTDEAVIKQLPNQLLVFQSEYIYLFFIIHSFYANPVAEFNHLYNLPNVVRRFIETFSAFKYLSAHNIDENLDRLINNSVKAERLRKFVHYHSHSITTAKLLQLFDPGECKAVIDILIDAIKSTDPDHYLALLSEVKFFNAVHLPQVI